MFTLETQSTTVLKPAAMVSRFFRRFIRLGARVHFVARRLARRAELLTRGLTLRKFMNLASAVARFLLRSERTAAYPVLAIVDLSPLCNLHCTVCVHAEPGDNTTLQRQQFHAGQMMSEADFRRIIDEIKGHTLGVLLYYLGDPLMHPQLAAFCRIAAEAGLNIHVSTNFSFRLSDEKIRDLISSGVTLLTVCLDGISQEKYSMTRVGGHLDLVLSNLKRACEFRRALGQRYPRIEVQYIKFQHNLDDVAEGQRVCRELGADQVHELWGWLHNYTDRDPGQFDVFEPVPDRWLPVCHWPHFFMLIKYNGDVIPCCAFRLGEQYTGGDARPVGNVFEAGVGATWQSPEYRQLRRWVSRPSAIRREPELSKTFCDDCPRLFNTNYTERTCRFADQYRFEDLYTIGPNGRPVRRRPATGTESAGAPHSEITSPAEGHSPSA
ncbi:MAG TPA: radical SAM protein [Phycisphaerae bacterium]|nr:radical SAM protein [Phycisphaerae bacterium]